MDVRMGKKKAAAGSDGFRCANVGCRVTGRDKVNKRCAGCARGVVLAAGPKAALGCARR